MSKLKKSQEEEEVIDEVKKEFSLDSFIKSLNKLKDVTVESSLAEETEPYKDVIPFSSINLNNATGIGGLPKGKIVEIIGWESAGKSTLSLDVIGNCQKKFNQPCMLIDKEQSFDRHYARRLGVNNNLLVKSVPNSLEDQYDVLEHTLDQCKFGVIVVDSLTAFEPQSTLNGDGGMTKEARINSARLKSIVAKAHKSNTLVIFINQMREKVGVMFGNPETTAGGNAMKFYASMRIMIRRKEIKAAEGYNTMSFKFIKNKNAEPFKESEIGIIWNKGFDTDGEALKLALQEGIMTKEGHSFFYEGTRLAKSKGELAEFFEANPELVKEITDKVKNTKNIIAIEGDSAFNDVKNEEEL